MHRAHRPAGTRTMLSLGRFLCVLLVCASCLLETSAGVERVHPVDLEWKVRLLVILGSHWAKTRTAEQYGLVCCARFPHSRHRLRTISVWMCTRGWILALLRQNRGACRWSLASYSCFFLERVVCHIVHVSPASLFYSYYHTSYCCLLYYSVLYNSMKCECAVSAEEMQGLLSLTLRDAS